MDRFLNYQQVAEILNMKLGTLYALVSTKQIPHYKVGKRIVRFSERELTSWMRGSRINCKIDVKEVAHD